MLRAVQSCWDSKQTLNLWERSGKPRRAIVCVLCAATVQNKPAHPQSSPTTPLHALCCLLLGLQSSSGAASTLERLTKETDTNIGQVHADVAAKKSLVSQCGPFVSLGQRGSRTHQNILSCD